MAPGRQAILLLIAGAAFFGGYALGRSSCSSAVAAAVAAGSSSAGSLSCPPAEPCVCNCQSPDRRLQEKPKGKLALPFDVGGGYKHLDPVVGGGENQHRGGDSKVPDAAAPPAAPAEPAPAAAAPAPPAEEEEEPWPHAAPRPSKEPKVKPAAGAEAEVPWPHAAPRPGSEEEKKLEAQKAALAEALKAPPAPGSPLSPKGSALVNNKGVSAVQGMKDQCDLPPPFRGLSTGSTWLDRAKVDVPFAVGSSVSVAKAYSTLAKDSRSAVRDQDTWKLVAEKAYDAKSLAVLKEILGGRPQDAFIDVGAWIGVTTLYAGALTNGKILSLEADPRAFEELRANVALNPGIAERTWAYRHCISDRAESRQHTTILGSTMYSMNLYDKNAAGAQPEGQEVTYDVQCSPLSELASSHGMEPANVALVRLYSEPGAELHIAGQLLDWVNTTPEGKPKPALWLTLFVYTWGDKALGECMEREAARLLQQREQAGAHASSSA
jgi:FkbM family methyltransferase